MARLSRLRSQLAREEGEAVARVRFQRGMDGRIRMVGSVRAEVWLVCQTCLDPVSVTLDSEFDLALVEDLGAASEAMPEMDVWLRDARLVDLREVVDQELSLALPQIPRHPERADCGGLAADPALLPPGAEVQPEPAEEPTRRPFEVLSGIAGDPAGSSSDSDRD